MTSLSFCIPIGSRWLGGVASFGGNLACPNCPCLVQVCDPLQALLGPVSGKNFKQYCAVMVADPGCF